MSALQIMLGTLLPMAFVTATTLTATTMTATVQMIRGQFGNDLADGLQTHQASLIFKGCANISVTCLRIGCFILIVAQAISRWHATLRGTRRS